MSDWADKKAEELCPSELQQKHVAQALRDAKKKGHVEEGLLWFFCITVTFLIASQFTTVTWHW
jgi:hypothetical protein